MTTSTGGEDDHMTEVSENRRTVLVVEDDPGVRSTLDQLLRFEGYRVLLASDGLEALGVLERDSPTWRWWTWSCPGWTVWRCAGCCGGAASGCPYWF